MLVALAKRIELWPIERLRPYERNPRTHSEAQVDQIAASMVEFGWTNPILVDENAGILIARPPDTMVGFGETRIHAETATFEDRASEVANPRPSDELTVGGESFVVQGETERRDPDQLVWTLDARRP